MRTTKTRYLDVMAMGVSVACVLHCLALPLIFATLPFLGAFNEDPVVHKMLVSIAAPLCVFALVWSGGWRRPGLVATAAVGLGLLGSAAFVATLETVEVPMSVTGACLLAVMHLINARSPHRHS